jgi:hypothetical protein
MEKGNGLNFEDILWHALVIIWILDWYDAQSIGSIDI